MAAAGAFSAASGASWLHSQLGVVDEFTDAVPKHIAETVDMQNGPREKVVEGRKQEGTMVTKSFDDMVKMQCTKRQEIAESIDKSSLKMYRTWRTSAGETDEELKQKAIDWEVKFWAQSEAAQAFAGVTPTPQEQPEEAQASGASSSDARLPGGRRRKTYRPWWAEAEAKATELHTFDPFMGNVVSPESL